MKRLNYIISVLLLLVAVCGEGVVFGDSHLLDDLFPRKALHIDGEGLKFVAELKLIRRGLYFSAYRELNGHGDGRFRCSSNGKLLSSVDKVKSWTNQEISVECTIHLNGGYGQVQRSLVGTIDRIEINHPEPYSVGETVVFQFLSPADHELFLEARRNNVAGEAFGTDEFWEDSSVSQSTTNKDQRNEQAIEQQFWKTIATSDDVNMYAAYLEAYPDGKYAPLARLHITKLNLESDKKNAEEDGARQLAKKKAEEEAARQLAKKKTEEEAARRLAKSTDNTIQVEFWKSIKDSDDPDMYRAYLSQYPDGEFAIIAKLKIRKLGGTSTPVTQPSIPMLDYGDYYALVIGNNRYDHLADLRTAVNDVRNLADLLEFDYGFNVTKLENANRNQIINSMSELRSKVSNEDNLLIYYAGHGYLDEEANEGFWLPVDASPDDPSNWIATDRVVGQVRAMKAKHVMVVADSCFSGTITRGIKIVPREPEWLETIVKKKARTALTSGGLEPVMDSGSGNNSVFANSFLSILRNNDGVLDASRLFSQLRPKVMVNSDQTPEYGDIHRAGHDGGDFLFVRQ